MKANRKTRRSYRRILKLQIKNRRNETSGAFGCGKKKIGNYSSLKVIPKSKRTNKNSNCCGVAI